MSGKFKCTCGGKCLACTMSSQEIESLKKTIAEQDAKIKQLRKQRDLEMELKRHAMKRETQQGFVEQLAKLQDELDWWHELVQKHHKNWAKENLRKIVQGFIDENAELKDCNRKCARIPCEVSENCEKVKEWREENAKLEEWYQSVMAAIENGSIAYYRCGECGGPVASGLCCPWCKSKDPVKLPESFYDKVKSLQEENEELKGELVKQDDEWREILKKEMTLMEKIYKVNADNNKIMPRLKEENVALKMRIETGAEENATNA